jgi:SAM-dependent methyltransferase
MIPMLKDKTENTPIEPIYYYQDTWACGELFTYKPKTHVDVASHATTVGIMSQFVPTTFVDIRPIDLSLPKMTFKKGSILQLPFSDNSVESFSSLCVLEHIGLGRYGDILDQWGTEKAFDEVKRVLKKKGHFLVSVPIDVQNNVYFNAHRAFTRKYILKMCDGLQLTAERYIYGRKMYTKYDPKKGFGVGLFHFIKQ